MPKELEIKAKDAKPGMTFIPIKKHDKIFLENKQMLTTVDLMWEIIKSTPAGGADYEIMAPRMKVWNVLETLHPDSTVVELPANDFAAFGKLALSFKFKVVDKFVFEFLHQFKQ